MYFRVLLLLYLVSCRPLDSNKHIASENEDNPSTTLIPNSCLNQADNSNVIVKLLDDDTYPPISVTCNNEYMIINLKQDRLWSKYLKSTREYHYNLIGPVKDDHVNWQEWIIPNMENFIVSYDCKICDENHELNQLYSTASGYYMTPVTSGCTQLPIGRIGCDMDYHSYACRVCETAQTREPGYWHSYEVYNGFNDPETTLHFEHEVDEESFAKYGLCGFTIRDAKATHTTDTFEHCKTVTHEDVESEQIMPRRKPSLGQDGRFCMCVKPNIEDYKEYEIPTEQLIEKQKQMEDEIEKEVLTDDEFNGFKSGKDELNIIQLYQKDFIDGTYRITQPGKYVIMEDIVFDFKAPDGYKEGELDTYNDIDNWWPTYDQIDDYPGAGDLKDSYFLGFWAGITIECPDVILELDHHKLAMSEAFFYQQSFFALISLTSQVFLPGQGPGFFGANPQHAENVMIRNGELGLTSHHAIQGNFNKNILIENIKIHDFKTHGIQFNGFDGITIKNVDVGPNRKIDRLTPYYAHMKALLPTYKMMVDREEIAQDTCVSFGDKECVTMKQLIHDIQILLDMAFEYVVLDKNYDEVDVGEYQNDDEFKRKMDLWKINRDVLINDHHSTQTATLYGIFLNYIGSNVIGWYAGSETTKSHNVFIDNVKIHDLHHDTYENIAFSQGDLTASQRILNCLNAPFNAYHIFGEDQVNMLSKCNNYITENSNTKECREFQKQDLKYYGNAIVDIQLLSFELINKYDLSWNYCSSGAADMAALVDFAIRGKQFDDLTPLLVGSHDPMIHPGKGVMGLRLNGVDKVDIKDLKIQNIHSSTDIGSELGGPYENVVSQQAPYMNGFSMNMVNGLTMTFATNVILSNVEVSHVISNTGLAYGVAAWFETHVNIIGKKGLAIHHIHAGAELAPSNEYRRDSYPNLKPEACAFRIYDDVIYDAAIDFDNNINQESNIDIKCVSGHTGCLMNNDQYTNIGYVQECDNDGTMDMNNRKNKLLYNTNNKNKNTYNNKGYYIMISVLIIGIIAIGIYYLFYSDYRRLSNKLINSENTPLLKQGL